MKLSPTMEDKLRKMDAQFRKMGPAARSNSSQSTQLALEKRGLIRWEGYGNPLRPYTITPAGREWLAANPEAEG